MLYDIYILLCASLRIYLGLFVCTPYLFFLRKRENIEDVAKAVSLFVHLNHTIKRNYVNIPVIVYGALENIAYVIL